jgi:hypothetical protein
MDGAFLPKEPPALELAPEFIPVRVTANALSMPQAAGKSASANDADPDLAPQPRRLRSKANWIEIVLSDGTCIVFIRRPR